MHIDEVKISPEQFAKGDRRKNKNRASIREILEMMQDDADDHHRGDLFNASLSVFSRLSLNDRKTFMRHALKLLWEEQISLSQRGQREVVLENDVKIDPVAIEAERCNIDEAKQIENEKFKNFFFRVFFIAMVLLFCIIVVIAIYAGKGPEIEDFISYLTKVLEVMFSIGKL